MHFSVKMSFVKLHWQINIEYIYIYIYILQNILIKQPPVISTTGDWYILHNKGNGCSSFLQYCPYYLIIRIIIRYDQNNLSLLKCQFIFILSLVVMCCNDLTTEIQIKLQYLSRVIRYRFKVSCTLVSD